MKKLFALLMVLVMCLSLCACGNSKYSEVDRLLQGEIPCSNRTYTFSKGRFSCDPDWDSWPVKEGKYKITEDKILLYYDDGVLKSELEYKYEGGKLSITTSNVELPY